MALSISESQKSFRSTTQVPHQPSVPWSTKRSRSGSTIVIQCAVFKIAHKLIALTAEASASLVPPFYQWLRSETRLIRQPVCLHPRPFRNSSSRLKPCIRIRESSVFIRLANRRDNRFHRYQSRPSPHAPAMHQCHLDNTQCSPVEYDP